MIHLAAFSTVKYIIHIADVHIRLQKRQDEYKIVFERLYSEIRKFIERQPEENTIIYLAGDIAHTKTDMSPEQADLLQEFLLQLCSLCTVILITGNHDCNLNNRSRLDALQPIVNAIRHPRLFYLKESGVYNYANVTFAVMSVFDKPSDYIKAEYIHTDNIKIALHHGAVNGSHTAIGYELINDNVNLSTFKGYDLALLGDIHLFQYLNDERTIAYASSLIQQDHGELLDHHGFIIWNLETKDSTFVEIENDYGYVTVEIEYGNIVKEPKKYPKKSRLKLKVHETTKSQIQECLVEIKNKTDVRSITTQKIKQLKSSVDNNSSVIEINDVRDVEIQNKLISDFLETKYDIFEDELLDGVRHINRNINSKIETTDLPRHTTYILKTFEFSNVFSYGPNNILDLQSMSGIYGIFAQNRTGKSSILDALMYCIFDTCSKTSSATDVLNNRSQSFTMKLKFELNSIDYYIERYGTKRESDGHVRVHVDFYYYDELGNKVILNGKERSDTNKIIRKYVGTYEDFILTSVTSQNNSTGFIEMTQRQRKELLGQFLDISRFEELYKIASEEVKDVSAVLKNFQKQDFSKQISDALLQINLLEVEHSDLEIKLNALKEQESNLRTKILNLTKQIVLTDADNLNIYSLNDELDKLQSLKSLYHEQSKTLLNENNTVKQRISEVELYINNLNKSDIDNALNARKAIENKKNKISSQIKSLEIHLEHANKKLKNLDGLEYDKDCKYCMNNIFVQDAISTKKWYHENNDLLVELINEHNSLVIELTNDKSLENYNDYMLSKQLLLQLTNQQSKIQIEIEKLKGNVSSTLTKIQDNLNKQELFRKNEDILLNNSRLETEINKLTNDLNSLLTTIKSLEHLLKTSFSNIQVHKEKKITAENNIAKMQQLEKEFRYYELYLAAVKRDGVPYSIICQVLPQIENEINNVLGQLVDFTITLQSDEKNINAYINYDEDNFWPIELVSGMEKFISSLAIRTALINITSLPKPNFIAIDEGFTQLDSENINSVYMLFSYLKSQFDFIIIISHLDVLRDMVDKFIDIRKENGFSKVELI